MQCPSITDFQSSTKGQKRLDQAIDSLGDDVVNKILVSFDLGDLGSKCTLTFFLEYS